MIPVSIGLGLININLTLDTVIAIQHSGSAAADLNFAFRLFMLPHWEHSNIAPTGGRVRGNSSCGLPGPVRNRPFASFDIDAIALLNCAE